MQVVTRGGQCVMLPLNVSLDIGSRRRAQHDLAMIDTDFPSHVL